MSLYIPIDIIVILGPSFIYFLSLFAANKSDRHILAILGYPIMLLLGTTIWGILLKIGLI